MTPIVLYLGPSAIDGAPIVVLATVGSHNVKTGTMVQTWILRADMSPVEASKRKADSSVCGQCPRRHSLRGVLGAMADCYVLIHNAPQSAWKAWDRAGKPGENWSDELQILRLGRDAKQSGLRLGSYGDPAAVPHHVWADLIEALQPRSVVGYTHQWRAIERHDRYCRSAGMPGECDLDGMARTAWFRNHVMASADSPQDALDARDLGWRVFLAVPEVTPASDIPSGFVTCPATTSDRTCATCGACDGSARGTSKASITLHEHGARSGAKAKRVAALVVLQPGR